MIDKIVKIKAMKMVLTVSLIILFIATCYPAFSIIRTLVGAWMIGWWTGTALGKLWSTNKL
jgi:hypothetical protein